ncbi:uncharacterized protein EI90DRAFT_2595008 [Cantharellus anzutake]|uniref:uncharacterized protein n=1 Tax=Cantharellus anzutake TaxID=1750568 RepID=UPI001907EF92|nr:uncharacterized protein EI90DRAFT_2595008 [Cantharellus anzutake]KAF8321048.1 hypothetical protein EI90DRAFT_2595008 [Cantharellus anzutake]
MGVNRATLMSCHRNWPDNRRLPISESYLPRALSSYADERSHHPEPTIHDPCRSCSLITATNPIHSIPSDMEPSNGCKFLANESVSRLASQSNFETSRSMMELMETLKRGGRSGGGLLNTTEEPHEGDDRASGWSLHSSWLGCKGVLDTCIRGESEGTVLGPVTELCPEQSQLTHQLHLSCMPQCSSLFPYCHLGSSRRRGSGW